MTGTTIERARGRWREILPALGIELRFLVNRHGPCPLCGGRDRFRFDDRDGGGSYFCNQCGAGSGVILIRKLHGWDHAMACREIDKIIGTDAPPQSAPAQTKDTPANRLAKIERVLAEATDPGIIEHYLAGRGLRTFPPVLRGHRALPYVDGESVRRLPAMVAPILGPDGKLQSAHRTYLGNVPDRKRTMPPVETIKGGAIRLFDHADELGIAEGAETALAAHELFGVPTWAAINAGNLEAFAPPEGVERLVIYGDHDGHNFVGQKAAYVLAARLARDMHDLDIAVMIPPTPGDWLDILNAQRPR